MNSPKNTAASNVRAEQEEKARTGTNVGPEREEARDTDEDPSAEPLLGARHAEEDDDDDVVDDNKDELPQDDDASSDLQQDK